MRTISRSLSAFVILGLLASACGGKDGSEVNGGDGNNGNGASSGGLNLGNGNGLGGGNGIGNGTVIDPNSACAKGTAAASLAGVNMIVMFDRSTSMNETAGQSGRSRWALASAALDAFFASNEAAGLNLALRFFPHDMPQAGCNQTACSVDACAVPMVGLGTLTAAPGDAHEKALIDATAGATPAPQGGGMMGMTSGGTPISAALGGALRWASAQHTKTPGENTVVVLVTDGQPNGCDQNIGNIARLAADALAADGTRTYAIGLTGSREGDMNEIAMAGGTTEGIFVADGANTTQDLLQALGAIRGEILDCDFAMPTPKPGVTVDPAFINVNFTPSNGAPSTLTQVAGEANCTGSGSWYYDNPANPTRIVLCKATCDAVTADAKATLDILLGCATSMEKPE